MGLTKEEFAAVPKCAPLKVDVPEFGGDGHTYLRRLSIGAREKWECWLLEAQEHGMAGAMKKFGGFRTYLLAHTLCDEHGSLIFDDPEEGVKILRELDGEAMDRLYDQAHAFCGLDKEAREELEGNLKAAPSDDSP